jgi:hypothetical protein
MFHSQPRQSNYRRRIRALNNFTSARRLKFEALELRSMLSASGDFNGDGADDLAISVAGYDVGSQQNAGAVNVIYGGGQGLKSDGNQWWTLDSAGVIGEAQANDGFGTVLAVGDFNRDGFDDLAIGAPGKLINSYAQAGAVTVLYGSSQGLLAAGNQFWSQDSQSINGHARAGDRFGLALAAGDFDGDGFSDLAVGTPGDDVGSNTDAGGVNVIFGSRIGLARAGDQLLRHSIEHVFRTPNENTTGKFFGSTVAAGDFDGDGHDDLVASMRKVTVPPYTSPLPRRPVFVGPLMPGEGGATIVAPQPSTPVVQSTPIPGGVDVLYGSITGISTSRVQNMLPAGDMAKTSQLSSASDDFFFGMALAAGDFNGDNRDDLAIGAPGAFDTAFGDPPSQNSPFGSYADIGRVYAVYSNPYGLNRLNTGTWLSPSDLGLRHETDQGFGLSLAAGDFNRDGKDDLAIGSPLADVNGQSDAGVVAVIYSNVYTSEIGETFVGLQSNQQQWNQDIGTISDSAEAGDLYGSQLIAGDYNGDGRADLGISVPNENQTGAVSALYGRGSGLVDNNNQLWTPTSPSIAGNSTTGSSSGLVGGGYGTITQNGGTIPVSGGTLNVTNSGYGVTLQGGTLSGYGTTNIHGGTLYGSGGSFTVGTANVNIGYPTDSRIWNANGGILNINSATLSTPIGTLIRSGALPQNAQINYDGVLYENVAQLVARNPSILS